MQSVSRRRPAWGGGVRSISRAAKARNCGHQLPDRSTTARPWTYPDQCCSHFSKSGNRPGTKNLNQINTFPLFPLFPLQNTIPCINERHSSPRFSIHQTLLALAAVPRLRARFGKRRTPRGRAYRGAGVGRPWPNAIGHGHSNRRRGLPRHTAWQSPRRPAG